MRCLLTLIVIMTLSARASAAQEFYCAVADTTTHYVPTGVCESGTGVAFADTVRALVVLVRFPDDHSDQLEWPNEVEGNPIPYDVLPAFAHTLLEEDSSIVHPGGLSRADSSLSAYFVHQSSSGLCPPHVLFGEVWPEVFVPKDDMPDYYLRGGNTRGFGHLTEDILDALDSSGMDFQRFDYNEDGLMDQLFLLVRNARYSIPPEVCGGDTITMYGHPWGGGWSGLDGRNAGTCTANSDAGPDRFPLTYDGVTVSMTRSGSQNVAPGPARTLLIHEYGHDLFAMNHTGMITANDVPLVAPDPPPTGRNRNACSYNRMCGGGGFDGYDPAAESLSGWELRRMGWAARTVLAPSGGNVAGVTLGSLYTTGDVALLPLSNQAGAPGDTLSLEVRRGTNYFDLVERPFYFHNPPGYVIGYGGLASSGLLATLTNGDPHALTSTAFDVLYADNQFASLIRCDGTAPGCDGPNLYQADLRRPTSVAQLTPWTRPNVSGFSEYPSNFVPNWFAVDSIRYVPSDADSSMAFDFYANYLDPGAGNRTVIRADSWIGDETDSETFARPVVVTNGSTLTIWQEPTVTFAQGLVVEPGARLLIESGPTLLFGPGEYLTVDGEIEVDGTGSDPVTFTRQNSSQAWGGIRVRGGGVIDYAHVYGADSGIETSAPALFVHNSHIAGNETGILTDYAVDDELIVRSFLYLENTCVSENTLDGVTARHTNIAVTGSAFDDNSWGLSLLDADIASVYDSRIAGNALGAVVGAAGELVLFDPGLVVHGHNRVLGSDGLELAAGEGAVLMVGVEGLGHNRVSDSGGFLIRNESGATVPARETWWGSASGASAGSFIGSVDSKDHLTSDASDPGPTCPSLSFGEGGAYAIAAPTARRPAAEGYAAGVTGASADPAVYYAALRREIVAARERTQLAASRPESMHADSAAAAVWRLAALQGLDRQDTLREAGATEAVLVSIRDLLGQAELHPTTRAASESALLAAIDGRLGASDADGATALLEWGSPRSQRPATVRGLTLRRAILDERAGRGAEAAAVYTAEAERLETAEFPELAALYRRQAALALREPTRGEAGVTGAATATSAVAFALGPARPNPTTGVTVLPLSLPAAADVQAAIYDALGRRVRVLHAGPLQAGMHDLSLDSAGLAPGVYVVRVVVDGDRRLTRRVTVVR